jgi:hypothetical protein
MIARQTGIERNQKALHGGLRMIAQRAEIER